MIMSTGQLFIILVASAAAAMKVVVHNERKLIKNTAEKSIVIFMLNPAVKWG